MHRRTFTLLLLLAACAGSSVPVIPGPPPPPPPPPTGTLRLLYVGNSLTDTWDIPWQVAQMAELGGLLRPLFKTVVVGGYSLEDHWNGGEVEISLAGAYHYDVMIMQQGPSTLESSGVNLTEYVGKFSQRAKQVGTRPAVYVVWPPKGGNLNAGIANHEAAATAADAALYPVGHAWRLAWAADPNMPLYGTDDFHPSEHGSWLAALVIVAMIFDKPVSTFPNLFASEINSTQEAVLRAAAADAIRLYGKR